MCVCVCVCVFFSYKPVSEDEARGCNNVPKVGMITKKKELKGEDAFLRFWEWLLTYFPILFPS